MATQFFGQNLAKSREAGFAHDTRWRSTSALKRLFSEQLRHQISELDSVSDLIRSLPPEFSEWGPLAQDQALENVTLLSPYLLSAQGDRMLMAHSVEGRFPFLDAEVMELAASLPAHYKLFALDEKHILKRAARDLVPAEIIKRKKQAYRAPDAYAFVGENRPEWVDEMMSETTSKRVGVFEPKAVSALWAKCLKQGGLAQFSNADNMAVVGVLSTHLLAETFVEKAGWMVENARLPNLATDIDRLV